MFSFFLFFTFLAKTKDASKESTIEDDDAIVFAEDVDPAEKEKYIQNKKIEAELGTFFEII